MKPSTVSVQTLWGDTIDEATIDDIRSLIRQTATMDAEHGAFWASNEYDDCSLEVHKNLTVILNLGASTDYEELRYHSTSWTEIEQLYELYLSEGSGAVKQLLESRR